MSSSQTEDADFRIVSKFPAGTKKNCASIDTSSGITKYRFSLGEVLAYNIDLDVVFGNGWTRITLKEIPRFIDNAFGVIIEKGLCLDGIFRKEGNSVRLNRAEVQDIYRGARPIPADFTVYDVCTMIKRFLKDLKPTLLNSGEFRKRLMEIGKRAKRLDQYEMSHHEVVELFETHPPMTPIHLGTLAYITRFLYRISQHSAEHKMNVDNLAVVLVGSIFGEFMGGGTETKRKSLQTRRVTQMEMRSRKEDMEVQVAAVKVLIVNSNSIGLSRTPYVSSNRAHQMPTIVRSTSAMPNISNCDDENLYEPTCSNSNKNFVNMVKHSASQRLLTRRDSDLSHLKVNEKRKNDEKTGKRSSSLFALQSLRGFRDKVSIQLLKRNKSPSPDRSLKRQVLKSIGDAVFKMTTPSSSPMRRNAPPVFDTHFERENEMGSPESPCAIKFRNSEGKKRESLGSTSSGRQSRSLHNRRGNINSMVFLKGTPSPQASPMASKSQTKSNTTNTSATINRSLRRVSQSEQNSFEQRKKMRESEDDESVKTLAECGDSTPPSVKKKKRFDILKEKSGVARRNTIEAFMCKSIRQRNNKIGADHPRRSTCWEVGTITEEKENARKCLIIEKQFDDSIAQGDDSFGSMSILERMDYHKRMRRAGVQERRRRNAAGGVSESMTVLNGSLAIIEQTSPISQMVKNSKEAERKMVDKMKPKDLNKSFELERKIMERVDEKKKAVMMTPKKENQPLNPNDTILTPKLVKAAHPTMEQYMTNATSSTGYLSPPGIRLEEIKKEEEKIKMMRLVVSENSNSRKPSVIPLQKLDSCGLKQNGLAWVGERQLIVSSAQPLRKFVNDRALSAAPDLARDVDVPPTPPPADFLKKQYRSSMREGGVTSPVLRRARDSKVHLAESKTVSPLVMRSKSHLCDEKVSNYIAFATPPRTRRAISPRRPSNLIFSTPALERRPFSVYGLATSPRQVNRSTSSLLTAPNRNVDIPKFEFPSDVQRKDEEEERIKKFDEVVFKVPMMPPMKTHELKGHRKTKSIDNAKEKEDASQQPRHQSASAVEESGRSSALSMDSDFGFGDYNEVLRNAPDETNLPTPHRNVESRPSVAKLRSSACGLVQSRIHQFQGMEQKSRTSMDSSRASVLSLKSTETVSSSEKH